MFKKISKGEYVAEINGIKVEVFREAYTYGRQYWAYQLPGQERVGCLHTMRIAMLAGIKAAMEVK
jgi:hypothetical protein